MMYINDDEIPNCLLNLKQLLRRNGRIYLKESVGITNRMTLNKVYSDELSSQYSAIYRSITEYEVLIKEYLLQDGFIILHRDNMWKGNLANRKETTTYFWIIEKL